MKRTQLLLIAGSVLGALTFSTAGQASPIGSSLRDFSSSKSMMVAPLAYHLFCLKTPKQCRASGKSVVHYDDVTIATLRRINSAVNRSIRYTSDRGDVWGANSGKGDCEDYVLEKRRKLIAAGLPASALRMAAVTTKRGEAHAVLVVKTTKGDLVLDNIRRTIVSRNNTGYSWRAVASANPLKWFRVR